MRESPQTNTSVRAEGQTTPKHIKRITLLKPVLCEAGDKPQERRRQDVPRRKSFHLVPEEFPRCPGSPKSSLNCEGARPGPELCPPAVPPHLLEPQR
ncbi:unnamed protein product [Boreogadus saida]